MYENEPLLNKSRAAIEGFHKITVNDLYLRLASSSEGLTTSIAKEKRHNIGLNYVKPPLSAPAWLCCLIPCLLSTTSMKKYNECVPDFGCVKRNGKWIKLDATSIVPGDIVRIGKGERVPADMRIIKSSGCVFDGSSVMGRSELIVCDVDKCTEEYLDSPNIAFLGYLCTTGECTGIVTETGANTLIAKLISKNAFPPSEY